MATDPTEPAASADASPQPPTKWFHFRWRTLLAIPLALLVLVGVYGPRQYKQRHALAALKELQATVRTNPVALPGLRELAGEEYAQEIIEVYWRNPNIGDDDLQALAGLTTITKLELSGAKITDAGLEHLRGLTGLDTLHLAGTQVTGPGLAALAALKNLRVLSLDNTRLADEGLASVAGIASLERLFLAETAITDQGLASLSQLKNLKELSLNRTRITDTGLERLRPLTSLEILRLNETATTDEGVKSLLRSLPNCQVLRPGANE